MILLAVPVPVPPVFDRISRCETGNNTRHSTLDFISRYGIRRVVWNEYRGPHVPPVPVRKTKGERIPTREEQDAVAMRIARIAGLTAWGCFRHNEWVRTGNE